ncbi:MAG: GerAB/ArcD/ProY family transporter [Clostridiales bacterium]
MAKNNLSSAQYTTYLLSGMVALCLMNLTPMLFKNFGQNSLLAIMLISAASLVLLLLVNFTACSCGYLSPHRICTNLFGKYVGSALSWLLVAYLLIFTALSLRIFIYIVNVYYLQKTPLIIIALVLILPSIYTVWGGIRVFGHSSTLVYLFIAAFLLVILLARNNYLVSNIFPLIDENVFTNLRHLPLFFITSSAILGSFFILPTIVNPQKIKRSIYLFTLISLGLMLFTYAIARFYFGDALKELILPFYNLSTIYKGRALERLDVVFILIFIPLLGLLNSFFFTTLHKAQRDILPNFNEKYQGITLVILGALEIFLATLPLPHGNIWEFYLIGSALNLPIIALLILLYGGYILKRRWLK